MPTIATKQTKNEENRQKNNYKKKCFLAVCLALPTFIRFIFLVSKVLIRFFANSVK